MCFICYDGDEEPRPTPLGCACRGDTGFAHPDCMVNMAVADGKHSKRCSKRWFECMTCKQRIAGTMFFELARRRWALEVKNPPTDLAVQEAAMNMAIALANKGQHAQSEELSRWVLTIQKNNLGPEHPNTLNTATVLAIALTRQKKYAEATAIGRETLEVQKRVLGKEHPNTLNTATFFAIALYNQGRLDVKEAVSMLRETLAAQNRVLGPEHPATQHTASKLAMLQQSITLADCCC